MKIFTHFTGRSNFFPAKFQVYNRYNVWLKLNCLEIYHARHSLKFWGVNISQFCQILLNNKFLWIEFLKFIIDARCGGSLIMNKICLFGKITTIYSSKILGYTLSMYAWHAVHAWYITCIPPMTQIKATTREILLDTELWLGQYTTNYYRHLVQWWQTQTPHL